MRPIGWYVTIALCCCTAIAHAEVHLISAATRTTHGLQGPFEIELSLEGVNIDGRLCAFQSIVLRFDAPPVAVDGAIDCDQEILVTDGTCNSVKVEGNNLVLRVGGAAETCTTITMNGLIDLVGDNDIEVFAERGNYNNDAFVDLLDMQLVKNHLFDQLDNDTVRYDLDCNGSINICGDLCPTKLYFYKPVACACRDSDADGTNDCDDQCPNDPKKTEPGTCGCGVADPDCDVVGAKWTLTVNGQDAATFLPETNVSLALEARLNTDGLPVSGWQSALIASHPDLFQYKQPPVTIVAPGYAQSDMIYRGPDDGVPLGNGPDDVVTVFAVAGQDRDPLTGNDITQVFEIESIGPLAAGTYTFHVGDSGWGHYFLNADAVRYHFGTPGVFTLTVEPPTLVSAVSRRLHENASESADFDLPLDLTGAPTVESRLDGVDPRIVLGFNQAVVASDGSMDCDDEIVVANGTCLDVEHNGETVSVGVTFGHNACVTLEASDLEAAVHGTPVSGNTTVRVLCHPGNASLSASVNILDLQTIKNALLQPVTAAKFQYDINTDHRINILDMQLTKNNLLQSAACP